MGGLRFGEFESPEGASAAKHDILIQKCPKVYVLRVFGSGEFDSAIFSSRKNQDFTANLRLAVLIRNFIPGLFGYGKLISDVENSFPNRRITWKLVPVGFWVPGAHSWRYFNRSNTIQNLYLLCYGISMSEWCFHSSMLCCIIVAINHIDQSWICPL